jgi:predicted nuclease of predicted toxin-antitoxin system
MKSSVLNSAPLEAPVVFLDRSLGHNVVADILRDAGYQVERHDDHFAQDAPDTEWIGAVAAKGWIILTKDRQIMSRVPELAAVAEAGARLYALSSANVTGQQMAAAFIKALPKIFRSLGQQKPPYASKIDSNGNVAIAWGHKELIQNLRSGNWERQKKTRSST